MATSQLQRAFNAAQVAETELDKIWRGGGHYIKGGRLDKRAVDRALVNAGIRSYPSIDDAEGWERVAAVLTNHVKALYELRPIEV